MLLRHYNTSAICTLWMCRLSCQTIVQSVPWNVWSGELLSWQKVGVDIVPAIPVSKEKVPKGVKYHDFMHDVIVVLKWTSSLIPKSHVYQAFQLGFSITEKDFFYGMPVYLREAYKLAKVNCNAYLYGHR